MTTCYGEPIERSTGVKVPVDGSQIGENVQLDLRALDGAPIARFDKEQAHLLIRALHCAYQHAFGEVP